MIRTIILLAVSIMLCACGCGEPRPAPTPTFEPDDVRNPAVQGTFYPSDPEELASMVDGFLASADRMDGDPIALIVPHAGYVYSGRTAGKTISRLEIKENAILLGPNHTGFGAPFSIMTEGNWQTPLGEITINSELAKSILNKSEYLTDDVDAHVHEHSLEVQLPFLQYYKPDVKIVPIMVTEGQISIYQDIGSSIASALKGSKLENSTLIIASSDMTHYEPQKQAKEKDKQAIEAILELNEDRLIDKIKRFSISMCGYVPTSIMLVAAKILGAKKAELIDYQTSGEVTGDYSSVVGYAGIIVK